MQCVKCGAKLQKGSNFCHVCGTSQQADNMPKTVAVVKMPEPKRKSNTLRIVLICLAVLIVLCAVPFILVFTNPAMDVCRALEKDDFAKTAEIFGSEIKDDTVTQTAAIAAVTMYVNNQCDNFTDGTASFETASENIQAVANMNIIDDKTTTAALSYVQRLNMSRIAWDAAEAAYAAGDYPTAIMQYAQVTNENYSKAQDNLAIAKDAYREQVLAEAQSYMDAQNTQAAADVIRNALTVLPEDGRLTQRLTFITEGQSDEALEAILTAAETQAAEGDYKGAVTTLNDAKAAYGEYAAYIERSAVILATCREQIITQADSVAKSYGNAAAAAAISDALVYMPDDELLVAERDKYAAAIPPAPSSSSVPTV